MKKVLFLLVATISYFTSTSQVFQKQTGYGTEFNRIVGDSAWHPPFLNTSSAVKSNAGRPALAINSGDSTLRLSTNGSAYNTKVFDQRDTVNTLATQYDIANLTGYVPTSRTISINGTTQDLSANRTYTINLQSAITAGATLTGNDTVDVNHYGLAFKNYKKFNIYEATGETGLSLDSSLHKGEVSAHRLNLGDINGSVVEDTIGFYAKRWYAPTIAQETPGGSYGVAIYKNNYVEYTNGPLLTPLVGGGAVGFLKFGATTSTFTAIAESDVTNLTTDLAAKAPTSRTISTSLPLSGGGDLSADRTLSIGGLSSYGSANQILGMNNPANGMEFKTISAGSGISVTNGTSAITIQASEVVYKVTGIDLKSTGNTTVITTATGQGRFFVTQVKVNITSVSGFSANASVSVGQTAAAYTDIASNQALSAGLNTLNSFQALTLVAPGVSVAANTPIVFKVNTGATATTLTATVFITGHYENY